MKQDAARQQRTDVTEALEQERSDVPWLLIILIGSGITLLWTLSYILIWTYFGNLDDAAKFGNIFQAAGALFTGFALAGVVAAILLQKKELELQREELKLTRSELAKTAKAQEASERALAKQAEALELTARLNSLAYLPIFVLEIGFGSKRPVVIIQNYGRVPAYNLSFHLLGSYFNRDRPLKDFLDRQGHAARRLEKYWEVEANEQYHISDTLEAFVLPSQMRLLGETGFPETPDFIGVLLQFRDTQGGHYLQEYLFMHSDSEKRFNLLRVDPITPQLGPIVKTEVPDQNTKVSHKAWPLKVEGEMVSASSKELVSNLIREWNESVPCTEFIIELHGLSERFTLLPINSNPRY